MINLRGLIEPDDDYVIGTIERGQLVVNGSKASIWSWDPAQRRYRCIDRLTQATAKELRDRVVVHGTSQMYGDVLQLAGAEREVSVTLFPRRCKECQ